MSRNLRDILRASVRRTSPRTPFLHITLSLALVVWGLEVVLPWSVWRICLGLYGLAWVGAAYLRQVFLWGIYLAPGEDEA